jgi:hypothetical protein
MRPALAGVSGPTGLSTGSYIRGSYSLERWTVAERASVERTHDMPGGRGGKKHHGLGTKGKGDGSGAMTEVPLEKVGEQGVV